jgi:AcrR family transcriptional regulator
MTDAATVNRPAAAPDGGDGPKKEQPATSRKRDAGATRAAILEAAKAQFTRLGYDRASLREIAAGAGVDAALVKRYFGGKEALFTEALKASFPPDHLSSWRRETFARDIATMMADKRAPDDERTQRFQFLLRAATSPTTAPLLNLAVQERFLEPIGEWLGGPDAHARGRVLAAVFIGFLVERLIRGESLTGHERDVFVEHAASTFEALLNAP